MLRTGIRHQDHAATKKDAVKTIGTVFTHLGYLFINQSLNIFMKHSVIKALFIAFVLIASCKSKPKDTDTTTVPQAPDTTVMTDQPAAVVISPDDSLTNNLKDATKDFPGVTAAVYNGEVTLTGNIERKDLPRLMQSVNSLHPKKINNNLTIK